MNIEIIKGPYKSEELSTGHYIKSFFIPESREFVTINMSIGDGISGLWPENIFNKKFRLGVLE